MADRKTDRPDQNTVRAKIARSLGGTLVADYGAALKAQADKKGGKGELIADSVLNAMLGGAMVAFPALLIEINMPLPEPTPDAPAAQIAANLNAENGYQGVGLNDGTRYALVKQDGRYALFRDLGGELHYEASPAQALEKIQTVTRDLSITINALEGGQLPTIDIPQIMTIGGLTQAYSTASGIERDYDSWTENAGSGSLLGAMKQAYAQWHAAGQTIANEGYGYTQAQQVALPLEAPAEKQIPLFISIVGAGMALIAGWPLYAAAPAAMRRNRARNKGLNNG